VVNSDGVVYPKFRVVLIYQRGAVVLLQLGQPGPVLARQAQVRQFDQELRLFRLLVALVGISPNIFSGALAEERRRRQICYAASPSARAHSTQRASPRRPVQALIGVRGVGIPCGRSWNRPGANNLEVHTPVEVVEGAQRKSEVRPQLQQKPLCIDSWRDNSDTPVGPKTHPFHPVLYPFGPSELLQSVDNAHVVDAWAGDRGGSHTAEEISQKVLVCGALVPLLVISVFLIVVLAAGGAGRAAAVAAGVQE